MNDWLVFAFVALIVANGWISERRREEDWIYIGRLREKNARLRREAGLPEEDEDRKPARRARGK